MKYRLSKLARADLVEIAEYSAEHYPEFGQRLLDAIRAKIQLLTTQPRIGAPRDDLRPDLRCTVVQQFVIYYQIDDPWVDVLRVVHGARDIKAIRFE